MKYNKNRFSELNCENNLFSYSPRFLTALFGSDTEESLSPLIHNKMYEKLNIPAVYKNFSISQDNFNTAYKAANVLSFKGINITYPFKEKAVTIVDKVEGIAEKIGAINTIDLGDNESYGYNTDYLALKKLFKIWFVEKNTELEFLIIGAGGAARAVAAAISSAQFLSAGKIFIANRTYNKAKNLTDELLDSSCNKGEVIKWKGNSIGEIVSRVNIVIDATTLGWKQKLFPGARRLSGDQRVFDLSYSAEPSPLLKLAAERGCKRENGLRMLLYQAQEAHKIWFEESEFDKNILPQNRFITMN